MSNIVIYTQQLSANPTYMSPTNTVTLASVTGLVEGATFGRPAPTVPDGYEGVYSVTNISGNTVTFTPSITFTPNMVVGSTIDFAVGGNTSSATILDITTVTNVIDITFPVAGQDNDTQGFRDNYAAIVTGMLVTGNAIGELQTVVNNINTRVNNTNIPTTSKGVSGDQPGQIASDGNYVYVCYGTYDGISDIWAKVTTTGVPWP